MNTKKILTVFNSIVKVVFGMVLKGALTYDSEIYRTWARIF